MIRNASEGRRGNVDKTGEPSYCLSETLKMVVQRFTESVLAVPETYAEIWIIEAKILVINSL